MKKITFLPGQKVPGYGVLNEFGEFEFTPSQVGSREGAIKVVTSGDNYTLSETSRSLIVHIRFNKEGSTLDRLRNFMNISNTILLKLKDYEF